MSRELTPDEFYNLSDDEISQLSPEVIEKLSKEEAPNDESTEDGTDEAQAEEGSKSDGDEEVEDQSESDTDEQDDGSEDISNEVKEPESSKVTEEKPAKVKNETNTDKVTDTGIDYKAAYERIMSPFKANGREMAVDSIDDALTLMQMGANYNKKMAGLKPNLKIMKLLENHDLLNEEKLNFLIDLDKKNPEAIKKLMKDSGIDPLDLDVKQESDYKPTQRSVNDKQLELDEVLEELQDMPTFGKVLNIATAVWDVKSKQEIVNDPQLLKVLNTHMASGVYDLISKEVDKQRTFGRLNGLSDLEAYKTVGDALHQQGGFKHLVANQNKTPPAAKNTAPVQKQAANAARNDKRRAASPTTAAPKAIAEPEINPLAMSDEDFEKMVKNKYI